MRWRRRHRLLVGNALSPLLWWLIVATVSSAAEHANFDSAPDRSGKGIELFREKKRFKLSDGQQEVLARVNKKMAQTSNTQRLEKDKDLVDKVLRLSLNVADDADKEEEKENHLPLSLQENISPRKEKESRDSPSEKKRLSTANKTNRGFSSRLPNRQRPRQRFPFGRDNFDVMGFSAVRAMEEFQLSRTPTKGRVRFENTIANSRRGWIAGESLFQCHVPGLYHFSFSARGASTTSSNRWRRSNRPCFTPSPPLDGVRVVEVDGFRFPWSPDIVRRNFKEDLSEKAEKSDQNSEPIVVDNLRNRYYYSNRHPPLGYTGDCEDERGGRVPSNQYPGGGGEWRVDLKLNGVTVVTIGGRNGTSASNSVLLQLDERDRVWVELVEGRIIEPHPDSATTSFLGFRISDGRSVEPSDGNVFGGDGADSSIVIESHVNYDYYPTSPSQPIDADGNIDMTSSGPFDDSFGQGPTRPSLDDNRPISDLGGFDNRPVNNLDVFDNRPVNDYDNDYDSRPINSFDSDYENFLNRPNDQRPSVLDARFPGSKPSRLPIIIETSVGIGPQSWKSERPRPPITPTPPRRPITKRPPRRPVNPRPPRPLTPRPATPRPPRPRPGPTDNLPSGGGTHITFFGRSDSEPRRFRKDRAQPTYRG